jgi:transcription antitermination protein NusB
MLNRRLIRIKVFKVLYSAILSGSKSINEAEKELLYSCDKTKDLYFFILNLSVALKKASDNKIESGLKKFQPTEEERNPNKKFSNNKFTQFLEEDDFFIKYCEKKGLLWIDELSIFVKKLYSTISNRDYFIDYLNNPESSMEEDCNLFINIFTQECEDNEDLEQILEDISVYWIDDLSFVLINIIKNINQFKTKSKMSYPSTFMKDDDKEFAISLLSNTIAHYDEYHNIFEENLSNWDSDRLVVTDIILIVLGISEAIHFSGIPIKVTINEYVDISKFYSTQNSKIFVNGLLDKIIQKMVESGKIVKTGRGLIDS